jgi:hypothetical protein
VPLVSWWLNPDIARLVEARPELAREVPEAVRKRME